VGVCFIWKIGILWVFYSYFVWNYYYENTGMFPIYILVNLLVVYVGKGLTGFETLECPIFILITVKKVYVTK
jgi:hypothetical protein